MTGDGGHARTIVHAQPDPPGQRPGAVARILAAAVVATVAGAVTAKVFGPKAGFLGFVAAATAHEVFDAPLARRLGALGL